MTGTDELLFEQIPDDPLLELGRWFDFAQVHSGQPNWNTLMLATCGEDAMPAVRPVLMKNYDASTGEVTFFTNYTSRKARTIDANPLVAAAMHWDHLERVIRIEGRAHRASAAVSDAYFASRGRESQIGAWASDQSAALDDWSTLVGRILETANRFGDRPVTRPEHWGGYVIVPSAIEFWAGRQSRIHERLRYERDPTAQAGAEAWKNVRRLFP